jgi:hypothetical protein
MMKSSWMGKINLDSNQHGCADGGGQHGWARSILVVVSMAVLMVVANISGQDQSWWWSAWLHLGDDGVHCLVRDRSKVTASYVMHVRLASR